MSADFYDALETRSRDEREAALMEALARQVVHAKAHSRAFAARLAHVDAAQVRSRAALAGLPILRKSDLHALQQREERAHGSAHDDSEHGAPPAGGGGSTNNNPHFDDPFGGFATVGFGREMPRVFMSPGPIFEPEGARPDHWRMARALYAAGFRARELVHNTFSYHFTPAGAMIESGAHAIGCTVFAAGTGQTAQQAQAAFDLRPAGYVGTPSFLKLILEKADELQLPLAGIFKKALFSGEAFPAPLRDWFAARGLDQCFQCYATADLGLIAYQSAVDAQGLVLDEGVIVEIVRPGTGEPVASDGEVGEVVVTTLNPTYPLLRFATGDLSAVLPGECASGRTNTRIRGWLGRADQTTKVRGMFVHPAQVAQIVRRFPDAVLRARLVVSGAPGSDRMLLKVETAHIATDARVWLAERIGEAIRDATRLRGEVEFVAAGSLPNDGRVIEDARAS